MRRTESHAGRVGEGREGTAIALAKARERPRDRRCVGLDHHCRQLDDHYFSLSGGVAELLLSGGSVCACTVVAASDAASIR